MPSTSPICSPAKPTFLTLGQALVEPKYPQEFYIVLTIGYNSEYKSDLTSERMTLEKAKMQYDRIIASLYHDQTGNFYGVALMQIDNPIAIEVEVL